MYRASLVRLAAGFAFAGILSLPSAALAGLITYDTWGGNTTADYTVTIDDNTVGKFTVEINVASGYQADVLAFGFDNGDTYNTAASLGFTLINPASLQAGFPKFFFDTNDCAQGCNWNGVVAQFDTIIKFEGPGAANGILESIKFSLARPTGATLDIFGTAGIRAQSVGVEPCGAGANSCGGSDKSFASVSPPITQVPEPGSLTLLGAGLVAFGLLRPRHRSP